MPQNSTLYGPILIHKFFILFMAAYQFQALDEDGKNRSGVIDSESVKSARAMLRQQNLIPLSVELFTQNASKTENLLQRDIFNSKVFNTSRLSVFTRQLAGLVSSGLPIERALAALAEDSGAPKQTNLISALRAEVNAGSSFAKALALFPREFPDVFTAVIASGEQSGNLGEVLERLADEQEDELALSAKLIAAALYPAIVSCIAIMIVLFLLSYVVPQVASVFASSKKALPLLTTIMLNVSELVRSYGFYILVLFVLIGIVFKQLLKKSHFRIQFDSYWLTLPILGKLAKSYNGAKFSNTLSMLSNAGVPILKGMQTAANTLSNHAMRADIEDAIIMVREGASLAQALSQKKRFPNLVPMFARLGEQTGQLPLMLGRCGKQLNTEVQRRAMGLATILEPLLIVAMGVMVMLIVLAVLMPIIQLNQLVR